MLFFMGRPEKNIDTLLVERPHRSGPAELKFVLKPLPIVLALIVLATLAAINAL